MVHSGPCSSKLCLITGNLLELSIVDMEVSSSGGYPMVPMFHPSHEDPPVWSFVKAIWLVVSTRWSMDNLWIINLWIWLVVDKTPLKNMKVNWDDYSQYMETCSKAPTSYGLGDPPVWETPIFTSTEEQRKKKHPSPIFLWILVGSKREPSIGLWHHPQYIE